MKKGRYLFKDWIADYGRVPLAKKLNVHPSNISHWISGLCYPKVRQMKALKRISRGRIGYEQILDGAEVQR